MRLVFMGTPSFAVPTLKALHEAGHDIAAIYTQPPRPAGRGQKEMPSLVHVYAFENHLPVYTPASLKTADAQDQFRAHRAEVAVVVAYGLLLPQQILDAYPLGCINVHPSLLPRWRGAAPIQRTIMAGDRETGIAIMQMDAGLDTGDVMMLERFQISKGMTGGTLHNTLSEKAGPLVIKTLEGLKNKTITPIKQVNTGVEYAKKISKDDCRIDFTKPAKHIYNQIMGLSPHPGAFFTYKDEIIKVFDAEFDDTPISAPAGTTVDDRLCIACNPGTIQIKTLQRPGKKRMSVEELMNGFPIPPKTTIA